MTTLTNGVVAIPTATSTIRLSREDGTALDPGDVVYETTDQGGGLTLTPVVDGDDLVYTQTYPIPANLFALGHVRITLNLPDGTVVNGHSEIKSGATVAASADYEYNVTA